MSEPATIMNIGHERPHGTWTYICIFCFFGWGVSFIDRGMCRRLVDIMLEDGRAV